MKSFSVTAYPTAAGLQAIDRKLGAPLAFIPISKIQSDFINDFYDAISPHLDKIPEIEGIADTGVDSVNIFLEQHHFDIKLDPTQDPLAISTAAVMDLLESWYDAGTITLIERGAPEIYRVYHSVEEHADCPAGPDYSTSQMVFKRIVRSRSWQNTFPAVKMPAKAVRVFHNPQHPSPIIQILTKTPDKVFITLAPETHASGFDLLRQVASWQTTAVPVQTEFTDFSFPMVAFDETTALDFLVGLQVTGGDATKTTPYKIDHALQQTRVRMNELGLRVKSAASFKMSITGYPPPTMMYCITRPFILWIARESLNWPLFAGYFAPDAWKNPNTLNI